MYSIFSIVFITFECIRYCNEYFEMYSNPYLVVSCSCTMVTDIFAALPWCYENILTVLENLQGCIVNYSLAFHPITVSILVYDS